MSLRLGLGRLLPNKSLLLLCDMQDKFAKSIQHFNEIVETSGKVAEIAKLLQIPIILTEHYPKGLGHTVPELKSKLPDVKVLEKTLFSMCNTQVMEHINKTNQNFESVILCGIEAHACVLNTCLDLLEMGKDVHIVVDAVSSRALPDRKYAFERMRQSGAFLTTSESLVFQFCRDAKHPKFKEIQKLIKNSSPDSSLLKI